MCHRCERSFWCCCRFRCFRLLRCVCSWRVLNMATGQFVVPVHVMDGIPNFTGAVSGITYGHGFKKERIDLDNIRCDYRRRLNVDAPWKVPDEAEIRAAFTRRCRWQFGQGFIVCMDTLDNEGQTLYWLRHTASPPFTCSFVFHFNLDDGRRCIRHVFVRD